VRESERRYRSLFENMLEGFAYCRMIYDGGRPQDFLYLDVNHAFATLTGLRNVVGKMVSEVIPGIRESNPLLFEVYGRVALTGRPERLEEYVAPLGIWFSIAVYSPEKGYFIAVFDNITERKTQETELEERVRSRTAELEFANSELEAFAYSISHDLRAPLRAIEGFSQIIVEEYTGKIDAEADRLLNVICANTRRMDQLITDLLALSRVSRGDMQFSRIDMAGLADSLYREIVPADVRQTFAFSVAPLPEACGDPTLIRQVWANLLSNAVKYTLPKDERRIEIGGYKDNDMNVYYVKDSGVGFNPAYVHKLFGVFQRLHRTEEFEGTGVGLAIVRRIVQRHGGETWAEGIVGHGATISFSMPDKVSHHEQL
jgi:signal transduction histidine kinase